MGLLDVKRLKLKYGQHTIIDDINFAVEKGDFITILGPNGSGKSTLVKLLSKTLKPSGGTVFFKGEDLIKLPALTIAHEMAVVPQETLVNFRFSAHEVVMMGRYPHLERFQSEGKRDFDVVKEAMSITRTWELRDRPVTDLSGGERQRVIIARALAQEPKLIILDEPTSHLDITSQVELLELLTLLNREKKVTVIMVLHDLNLAAQYSQKILLVKKGDIFAVGSPGQVITAENIEQVYGTEVIIWPHPLRNCPQVSVIGKKHARTSEGKPVKVHLICGGGVGTEVMNELSNLGCKMSAGVLNIGDSDWDHARKLNIALAEEAPYSPIGEKAFDSAKELISKSDVVAVLNIPIGPGNLDNIRIAAEALRLGKKTFIIGEDIEKRDYTGGKGIEIFRQLLNNGAIALNNSEDLLNRINHMMEKQG